ncbi:hypothetical protein EON66_09395 [archaeon]|nr:MAG: hypothetical protein EON66_09395 [archaeon]
MNTEWMGEMCGGLCGWRAVVTPSRDESFICFHGTASHTPRATLPGARHARYTAAHGAPACGRPGFVCDKQHAVGMHDWLRKPRTSGPCSRRTILASPPLHFCSTSSPYVCTHTVASSTALSVHAASGVRASFPRRLWPCDATRARAGLPQLANIALRLLALPVLSVAV